MGELKTKPTRKSVTEFLQTVTPEQRREDCFAILRIMERITGEPAVLWGTSIVGFGTYHYKYASGHEGDMCITGFSPRKQSLVVYLAPGFERRADLMQQLGKHKTGVSCLYISRLSEIDLDILEKLIRASVEYTRVNQAAC